MAAVASLSRKQLSDLYMEYIRKFPYNSQSDDSIHRHHFLQRLNNRIMMHSLWAMGASGASAYFLSNFLENNTIATPFLKKLGPTRVKGALTLGVIGLYIGLGRIQLIRLNDIIDLKSQYGREFMSVIMLHYPQKVNYELINSEHSDLLRIANMQQPSSPPPAHYPANQ